MKSKKQFVISVLVLFIAIVFTVKLFHLQVISSDYKLAARDNTVKQHYIEPYRGQIVDRNGKMLANNVPVFDLYMVYRKVNMEDSSRVCQLLNLTHTEFIEAIQKMKKDRGYSSYKPSLFIRNFSAEDYAHIQDKFHFIGYSFEVRTERNYAHPSFAHGLGYTAEISKRELDRYGESNYINGDNIGKTGIENYYEKELKGKKGIEYKIVNVKGLEKGRFKGGAYDSTAIAGYPLVSSVDLDIQQYAEELMQGKKGSVVAIEPSTGEILCFVSSPNYDPRYLTGRKYSKHMSLLQLNSNKPLYNRAIKAPYPPGSTFKPVAALIALQEKVIKPSERIACFGKLKTLHVKDHVSGYIGIEEAIQKSSNIFFGKLFMKTVQQGVKEDWRKDSQYGLDRWKKMVNSFGLGTDLNTDISGEKKGFVPNSAYYNKKFGRWSAETIFSLGIGQGELGATPLQLANIAAIIANKGFYYIPHIIKKIGVGNKQIPIDERFTKKHYTMVEKQHFPIVIEGMERVVSPGGTARLAIIPDITVCGKTGTAQNPHGDDHSVFIAFAPKHNPVIAICTFVENIGAGGEAAAPISSLVMEKYIRGSIIDSRKWIETYVKNKKTIIDE
ncbi:MAG: penicillin-binding protein 2 [Cyclobacteriaceae bacterium]